MKAGKLLILILGLAGELALPARGQGLTAPLESAVPKITYFLAVPMTNSVCVQPTNGPLKYTTATLYGYKATGGTAPTNNSASVTVGFGTQNPSNSLAHLNTNLVETLAAGASIQINAPAGVKYDLSDIFLLGGTGDEVLIEYEQ